MREIVDLYWADIDDKILGDADRDFEERKLLYQEKVGSSGSDHLRSGAAPEILRGLKGDDSLVGGGGNDILNGGPGKDLLIGGTGDDTTSYSSALKGVKMSLGKSASNSGDAAGDATYQIENLEGSRFADVLVGNSVRNTIHGQGGTDRVFGGGGNDILVGGPGGDHIYGGPGRDIASYAGSLGPVTVDLATPSGNRGDARGDSYSKIEDIEGSWFNDTLRGDAGVNRISGGPGSDILTGRRGNDILMGGSGSDVLNGGLGRDVISYQQSDSGVVVDLFDPDQNTAEAAGDKYISIEAVSGSRFSDTINGAGSGDTLYGAGGSDVLIGRSGADRLEGGVGQDRLDGGPGSDRLYGGADQDTLIGGLGRDYMSGGADSSFFVFRSAMEAGIGATRDRILDFSRGRDLIVLTRIDARSDLPGNQAFDFIGATDFSGAAGELRFDNGLLEGDIDGDSLADFDVAIADVDFLSVSDILF